MLVTLREKRNSPSASFFPKCQKSGTRGREALEEGPLPRVQHSGKRGTRGRKVVLNGANGRRYFKNTLPRMPHPSTWGSKPLPRVPSPSTRGRDPSPSFSLLLLVIYIFPLPKLKLYVSQCKTKYAFRIEFFI
jgi:hypothetical protein